MGLAFVNAFLKKNADVRVVSGNVNFKYPPNKNLTVFDVETNQEMLDKMNKILSMKIQIK
jgi:phosphopantothenoylcysteine synthetase/decarboxylase